MDKSRNTTLDFIKGLLIVFIIITHCPLSFEKPAALRILLDTAVPAFLMISGYVNALSYNRKGINTPARAYETGLIIKKLLRFAIPFTIAFFAQWIIFRLKKVYLVNIITYGPLAFIKDWLTGGKGMGSYYFPVMYQFVILFPIIYFVIRKMAFKGLIGCFAVTFLLEALKTFCNMDAETYRLLAFRYIFIIAAGCYVALYGLEKHNVLLRILSTLIGLFFAILFTATGYEPKIVTFWSTTCLLCNLLIIPALGWCLLKVSIAFKPIEIIGRASYNIFLVQMIYYCFPDEIAKALPNDWARLFVSIILCVSVGLVFYLMETPLTRKITSLIK